MPETRQNRQLLTAKVRSVRLDFFFRRVIVTQHMKQIHSSENVETAGLRLNKALARFGIASRRAADAMIQGGRVTVNGILVTEPGTRIDPANDAVTVDGKMLSLTEETSHTYILCNKPVQVVSTAKDPQGRETVLDLLPSQYAKKRIYPVGRLDYFSEGLLLLTDDGELTLRLTHPRYHLPKTYLVTLREMPSEAVLETMRHGMTLAEGEKLAPVKITKLKEKEAMLEMVLGQGVNRQIRRMCRDLNLTILRLQRVASGPLWLGNLPSGAVRELTVGEIDALKKAVGL